MNAGELLSLRVNSLVFEAQGVFSIELQAPDRRVLPPFTAGAHIDLHLPNGLIRSYSLVNAQTERDRYVVGVSKDANSRGGSRYIHEVLRPGDSVTVSAPRNNFTLNESAEQSVFIAGGIGITPILCMIRRLEALKKPWKLYYCARTRKAAPFLRELTELANGDDQRVVHNFDAERGGQLLDITEAIAGYDDADIYCCGPLPMLEAFERATAKLESEKIHVEYFAAKQAPSTEGGFDVELAKSNKTLHVPKGKTILDTVLDAGVVVPFSCLEGICGSCETKIISGEVDHRDLLLSEQEKSANKTMMICCSGSKGGKLVLDL